MPELLNTNEMKILKTDKDAKDGQNKCPKCGATDISLNTKKGMLTCNFCRHEFELEKTEGWEEDIANLEGEIIGSGAQNINQDFENIITLKCSSCGAEVVIDTEESTQSRCHWCRNTLSINEQIPNGAIPDVVLPFSINKNEAKEQIEKFVNTRKFFAHPIFKKEFMSDNVMGVYLPYVIVDVNTHANFSGQGEHETKRYKIKVGDTEKTCYDADVYDVEREFDITIDDLTVESSSDKLDKYAKGKTNNIINSIMPFDTENVLKWNANYLKGFSSEKRDTNIDDLRPIVERQAKDIARFAANDTLKFYDRGVRWDTENLNIKGKQWKTAYLPVWLYSYMQKKGEKNLLHYVAVNARTKETMGSIPINMLKLFGISAIIEFLGLIGSIFTMLITDEEWPWIFLLSGIIFFVCMFARYRNKGARHSHETETKKNMFNLRKADTFVKKEKGLSSSMMDGANNTKING